MKNVPTIFKHRDNFIDSFDRVFDQMVHKQFPTLTDELGLDFLKTAYPKVDIVDFKDRLEITSEIPGLTKKDIVDAIYEYWKQIEKYPTVLTWGYGDSLDRERVRDIILEQPQFTLSGV